MDDFHVSSNSPLASQMSPEYDASKAPYLSLPKSGIERSLDECYYKVRATIEGMANDILRLGNPRSGHIITRWDLQQVQIDVTGTIFKPHPYVSLFGEDSECNTNQYIYAPVITIPLPRSVLATDSRVKLLRDALLYDESGEFRGPRGIPFRQHPVYRQFTLEFINPYSTSTAPSRSLWCPSTAVYLPDPRAMFSEEYAAFILHDTWDAAGLRDWSSLCKKARKSHEKQVLSKASKYEDEGGQDGETGVPEGLPDYGSDPVERISSAKPSPSICTQGSDSLLDEPGRVDKGDDIAQNDLLQQRFRNALKRYPVHTLNKLKVHLRTIFKAFACFAEEELRIRLGLTEKLDIEFKLKRSPADNQEKWCTVVATWIIVRVEDVLRQYERGINCTGISWTHLLVVVLIFEPIDDQGKPYIHYTTPKMVFLLTADKENCVLHNTMIPGEAEAIYTQRIKPKASEDL
ncbi:uncharacterized protein F4807DRAFT_462993 [Annulohypoxylon truncatum]|uniref:uncharacterized protein n=1 Tax=Annulohypoxylon truncatum TaxID=327061 RepID=UPI002007CD1B|nr:uncharacterized protein F4807DRAFT_462993 [Annulohypoxylon truncatum]KAI1207261.1 hypothetical protein F4807DRAFT_462993 [Annulohypoxylon truncatum]